MASVPVSAVVLRPSKKARVGRMAGIRRPVLGKNIVNPVSNLFSDCIKSIFRLHAMRPRSPEEEGAGPSALPVAGRGQRGQRRTA